MKEFVLRIWKDPVWSKVIANIIWAIIIASVGAIYLVWNKISLREFLLTKIEVYWIVSGFGVLLFIVTLSTFLRPRPKKNKEEEYIKEEIRKIGNFTIGGDYYWTWDIVFHNGLKFEIQETTPYCNKHKPKMKLVEGSYDLRCPVCNASIDYIQLSKAENIIISMVTDKIDELKKSLSMKI